MAFVKKKQKKGRLPEDYRLWSLNFTPPPQQKAYFISLSSRSASFFCFLMSSRLRRASARSLTARSRSRRRLSHRVLANESEGKGDG